MQRRPIPGTRQADETVAVSCLSDRSDGLGLKAHRSKGKASVECDPEVKEPNAKDKYNDEQSQSVVFQSIVIAGTRLLILADQRLRVEVVVFEVPAPPVRGEGPPVPAHCAGGTDVLLTGSC